MSIIEKIKFAEIIEATLTVIHTSEWDVHGIEAGIEIDIDGETVTVDGADPMFSEVLQHLSPNDVSYCRQSLSRQNLHDYCRLVIGTPFIDKSYGMKLVERAVRIVQNIEARPADWKGDTRA